MEYIMSSQNKKYTDNFLVQGSILAFTSILVRIIGLVYRIPMARILGNEGIGYYGYAFEIYNFCFIISSYGMPMAVSKLVSERTAKKEYKKAMDSIYWCAIYSTYYRELKTIKEDLIKTNPKLNPKLRPKIEAKMKEIEAKIKALDWNCRIKANKNNLVKNAVLRQTTYETCKYNYYLEYLKEYNQKVWNLIDTKWKKSVWILDITNELSNKLNAIDSEIERIYNTYPIVFQAYNDYENNITSHILLDLLQQDFKVFRLWLHKTLNPLNQVIYKISNAMRR